MYITFSFYFKLFVFYLNFIKIWNIIYDSKNLIDFCETFSRSIYSLKCLRCLFQTNMRFTKLLTLVLSLNKRWCVFYNSLAVNFFHAEDFLIWIVVADEHYSQSTANNDQLIKVGVFYSTKQISVPDSVLILLKLNFNVRSSFSATYGQLMHR